jgi:hypothetical protein
MNIRFLVRSCLILAAPFFSLNQLYAEDICEPSSESIWDYHPIHIGGNGIAIGNADLEIKKSGTQDGVLSFNKANLFLYCFLPISKTSYFLPRVEWNTFNLDWKKNPKFQDTYFNYIQFALTFLTIGIEKWRWIARAEYNVDVKHFSHGKTYGLFSALLWGTYQIHRKWHYHVGAVGYTGFEGQEIYPIIGVDYSPNKKWMFQAVFPVTYSIEYSFNKEWRLSLKGRPLKERFRAGKLEPQPRSVFSYSSMGAELNLHYEKFLNLEIELFGGYNFGGSFYIKDRNGRNSLYTNVQGAPYGGASINWGI